MNRLPFGIGDFLVELKEIGTSVKGDDPGHPFRGNQYGASGSSGGKIGEGKEPPEPKIANGYKLHDQFTTRKGNAIYAVQKPADDSDRGWMITRSSRVSNKSYTSFGKPTHTVEMRDTKDAIQKEFDSLKRYEG